MKLRVNLFTKDIENVQPVTSPQIYDNKTKKFHPHGIFSEQIFGPVKNYQCQCGKYKGRQYEGIRCDECGVLVTTNAVRRTTYSKINLPFEVPHPLALYFLFKRNKQLQNRFKSFDPEVLDEIITALQEDDSPYLVSLRELDALFTDVIPVIPPDLRPLITKYQADDFNSYYVSLLELLTKHLLTYTEDHLRLAVTKRYYDLFMYVYERVPKKEGLIRQSLLGKETDFSARTVITVDPSLPLDTVSVSKWILLDILRPLIIHHLISFKINPTYADEMIKKALTFKQSMPELDTVLNLILDQGVYITLNRQPTLHRGSLMGFKVVANEDNVIKINPLVCPPYNADFDGDQMAIYTPLTKEASDDVKKMSFVNNLLVPGSMEFDNFGQNIVYGIYKITKKEPSENDVIGEFESLDDFVKWFNQQESNLKYLTKSVKINEELTTVARAYISYLVGSDKVINKAINKKLLNKLVTVTLAKYYIEGKEFNIENLQILQLLGTITSRDLTLTLEDFILDDETKQEIETIKQGLKQMFKQNPKAIKTNIAVTQKALNKLADKVLPKIGYNFRSMIQAGSKGNKSQMAQMFVAKGFVTDVDNTFVPYPIFSSLREGLTPSEFLIMSKASRKGSADRSIKTAEPGDLTRKLVFGLNPVELQEGYCGTQDFLEVTLTDSNKDLYLFRYIRDNDQDVLLTYDNIDNYVGKTVKLYSPIFCKSDKVCEKCFGVYNRYLKSPYIGMISSQSLGERATQLIMRTFHTGGGADLSGIDLPSEYLEEIDGEIVVKKDFIILEEFNAGTLSNSKTFTIQDPDTENVSSFSLPSYSEIYQSYAANSTVKAGSKIAKLPDTSANIVGAIDFVKRILETKTIENYTYIKLYEVLRDIFGSLGVKSIWYEILISELMRDPDDPVKRWRTTEDRHLKQPHLIPITHLPFMRPLLAIAFQNIGKSLSVIAKHKELDIQDLTVLERIFLSRF